MQVPDTELVYGIHAVAAVLDEDPSSIRDVWVATGSTRAMQLSERVEAAGLAVHRTDRGHLDELASGGNHQGVVARVRPRPQLAWGDFLDEAEAAAGRGRGEAPAGSSMPVLLALDQVQDPRNLGACVRSAAAAGILGVVTPRWRAAGITSAVRRAAAGGAERIQVAEAPNLARALAELAQRGYLIVGADAEAPEAAWEADLSGPLVLVLGGEERGLRRLTREHCDRFVSIPMTAGGATLNVSVAGGILLYEVARQHRTRG